MSTTRIFTAKDHPEANGRKPRSGDVGYTIEFPMEDGSITKIRFGREGFMALSDMVINNLAADAQEPEGGRNNDRY